MIKLANIKIYEDKYDANYKDISSLLLDTEMFLEFEGHPKINLEYFISIFEDLFLDYYYCQNGNYYFEDNDRYKMVIRFPHDNVLNGILIKYKLIEGTAFILNFKELPKY